MLAWCPFVDDELFRKIVTGVMNRTVSGLGKEGHTYRGFLYAGLMLTDDGPKVLEFNCRLGDPEAETLMPRLKSDLVPFMAAAARGALPTDRPLEWLKGSPVTVIAAWAGYPSSYKTGVPISGLQDAASVEGDFADGTVRLANHATGLRLSFASSQPMTLRIDLPTTAGLAAQVTRDGRTVAFRAVARTVLHMATTSPGVRFRLNGRDLVMDITPSAHATSEMVVSTKRTTT